MQASDLASCAAMSQQLGWPHRLADWQQQFAHAQGWVAECEHRLLATGQSWRWGDRHASIGLVIVSPDCQSQGLGRRLMQHLLAPLSDCKLLLHATPAGRPLYEKLGFVRHGGISQHQGLVVPPATPIALTQGGQLRACRASDLPRLQTLDAMACGMPRPQLIADLLRAAHSAVVLTQSEIVQGFALLRRFGRGHVIGPVVAPNRLGAQALIAHLAARNAGAFTRIDIHDDHGLSDWLLALGLACVDQTVSMWRGVPPPSTHNELQSFALVSQSLG